jgi:biopolymer transport protein ExbB
MIELFQKGGVLMYPLLLCSVIALAVILERAIQFIRAGSSTCWIEDLRIPIQKRDFAEASALAEKRRGPAAALVREILEHSSLPRGELERRVSAAGSTELKRLSAHLHLLELIGRIAPMLGLSGTVLGLTRTFQTVARVKTFANPALLANGIWEALITTVAGLFIGIPALVFHHFFENRLTSISFEMKSKAEEIIAELGEHR